MSARVASTVAQRHFVIEPDSLDRAAFSSVAELLQARAPGLSVTRRGDGTTAMHARGPTTLFADNAPLLIIDGVRISLARSRFEEFEGRPSPLDDIDVEQVERIEVLAGPSGAALYGTGAANGVIRISTRDAQATATRWRIFAAAGGLNETKSYERTFWRPGSTSFGVTSGCTRRLEATGGCTPTGSVESINPLEDERAIGSASLARVGGSVSSGSELFAWYGGTTYEREGSVIDLSARQRLHTRGAARVKLGPRSELSLRGHWMDGSAPLTTSLFEPLREQGMIIPQSPTVWTGLTRYPEPKRDVSRRGISLAAEWGAAPWLRGSVFTGLEYSSGRDSYTYTLPSTSTTYTSTEYTRQSRHDFNGRADVTAEYRLGSFLHAQTTALVELLEHRRLDRFEQWSGDEDGLSSVSSTRIAYDDDIAGLALEQAVSIADRATLRLAVRREDLHTFGLRWKTPWYPHASIEWIAAKEDDGAIGGVRFHAAYGKAGALPSIDHLLFVFLPPGSRALERKVEVSAEREVGFDASFLGKRVDASFAWYSKRTSDVLTPSMDPWVFGEILNRGIESSLRVRLIDAPRTKWNVRLGYAHNHNEVTSAAAPSVYVTRQWLREGVPLMAYAGYSALSAVDHDGDGVLENSCFAFQALSCEVVYGPEPTFHPAFPPTEASLENAFSFGPVVVSFLIDHRRGHYLHNLTEAYRCAFGRCEDAYATSLSRDAAIQQASVGGSNSFDAGAFIENATFTKLRELSVRVEAPGEWARALGGSRLELSLAGRNLATWTDYTGMDPEASSYGDNSVMVGDLASAPLPRSLSLRVTLSQ